MGSKVTKAPPPEHEGKEPFKPEKGQAAGEITLGATSSLEDKPKSPETTSIPTKQQPAPPSVVSPDEEASNGEESALSHRVWAKVDDQVDTILRENSQDPSAVDQEGAQHLHEPVPKQGMERDFTVESGFEQYATSQNKRHSEDYSVDSSDVKQPTPEVEGDLANSTSRIRTLVRNSTMDSIESNDSQDDTDWIEKFRKANTEKASTKEFNDSIFSATTYEGVGTAVSSPDKQSSRGASSLGQADPHQPLLPSSSTNSVQDKALARKLSTLLDDRGVLDDADEELMNEIIGY